jgi:hypothetical protein
LAAARAQGGVAGNPALRSRNPAVRRKIATVCAQARPAALLPGSDGWLAVVRRLRSGRSRDEATEAVNAALPPGQAPFTRERLVRTVRLFVREGPAESAPAGPGATALGRASLADIGADLTRMCVAPRSGGA